jgi:acyl-CoA synthetase (AMP-forming)/AMP-acid ligase II
MRTIAEVLRWRGRRHPDLPIMWFAGRTRTFAEVDRSTNDLANGLINTLNVKPGDRVAILDKNTDAYLELLFALDKAGAVATPVNWRLTAPEVARVVGDAEPVALVVGEEFRANADQVDCRVLGFDELPRSAGPDPKRDREEAVTWQLYTSGTTGLPKGAMLTNLNLTGGIMTALPIELPEMKEGTAGLVAMPLYHIGGCGWALAVMACGGCAVVVRDFLPQEVLKTMIDQKVEVAFLVPAALLFLTQLPESQGADYSSFKNIAYGASPISEELLKRSIATFGCRFTQVYGLTETTGAITFLQHEDHHGERMLSCGRAGFAQDILIVDPEDKEVPYGEIGEVVYRGPGTMAGYYRRDEDTASVMRNGWFHTGDAGTMDPDGYIYIKDRIKDMIVSGGENIYPAELESELAAHPKVADVAVIGVPDDKWGEAVKAIVVPRPDSGLTEDELIEWAKERRAGFTRPRSADFVQSIPRNPSGKILKRELRDKYWQGQERMVH